MSKRGNSGLNAQPIIIAILASVLGCFIVVLIILSATGVIKVGENTDIDSDSSAIEKTDTKKDTTGGTDTTDTSGIIENPNQLVKVNGNLFEVDDFAFYLPYKFEAGGKNNDGAYTFNLVNDDGWAQVLVYAEKSSSTPEKYLASISPYLDITDKNYQMNGTTWVQGENASSLAYATELDGKIYAIYYAVKLDSDATSEAMSMIPKTLYMKKIYQE